MPDGYPDSWQIQYILKARAILCCWFYFPSYRSKPYKTHKFGSKSFDP